MATTTQISCHGGPLLGRTRLHHKKQRDHDPSSWKNFEPLITREGKEQFILLPNSRSVAVLAYETGNLVAFLVPSLENEKDAVLIESICLARHPKDDKHVEEMFISDDKGVLEPSYVTDEVLLVGCNDGTVREFALSIITKKKMSIGSKCGLYHINEPCCGPRRVFTLKAGCPIVKLTSPMVDVQSGILAFCIIETKSVKQTITQEFHRLVFEKFDSMKVKQKFDLSEKTDILDQFVSCVGDRKGKFMNTLPFKIMSTFSKIETKFSNDNGRKSNVFVVIANSSGVKVHHEQIDSEGNSTKHFKLVKLPVAALSAITVSPNGSNLAYGCWNGEIHIWTDLFLAVSQYNTDMEAGKKLRDPLKKVLRRTLQHWHVNAVTALSYQDSDCVDPLLYSGGEESVLVVWQLARGIHRPAQTVPRVAKGGISHLIATGKGSRPGIIIYCEDNTLQLYEAHNLDVFWKVQGLIGSSEESTIMNDQDLILLSSPLQSAGKLHWFDPKEQRVKTQLEVIPFNRVSRGTRIKILLPPPRITHVALSAEKGDMVTAEAVFTENSLVGAKQRLKNGKEIGAVSTIKFWAKAPENAKERYYITAVMAFPHGESNTISALTMSQNGQVTCTMSNDENAFRLWRRTPEDGSKDVNRRRPVWECQYKVTTPSGFSNFSTPSQGLDFSSDGTTLCVVYGHMITLWDHRSATLLKTLRHVNQELIERVEFIDSAKSRDFILTKSKTGIKVQSPYGSKGWSFVLPKGGNAMISQAKAINSEKIVIGVYFFTSNKTKIICVDSNTGLPCLSSGLVCEIPSKVHNLAMVGSQLDRKSGYINFMEEKGKDEVESIRLFVLTEDDDLLMIQKADDRFTLKDAVPSVVRNLDNQGVPRIHMNINKKRVLSEDDFIGGEEPPIKRAAILTFMGHEEKTQDSSELPSLSGNFLRSFLSRNMQREKKMVNEKNMSLTL